MILYIAAALAGLATVAAAVGLLILIAGKLALARRLGRYAVLAGVTSMAIAGAAVAFVFLVRQPGDAASRATKVAATVAEALNCSACAVIACLLAGIVWAVAARRLQRAG